MENRYRFFITNPVVVTNVTGGHLALLIRPEKYADMVSGYIGKRMRGIASAAAQVRILL